MDECHDNFEQPSMGKPRLPAKGKAEWIYTNELTCREDVLTYSDVQKRIRITEESAHSSNH
jgi:hypothetical protein